MGLPYSKQINAAFDQVTPLVAEGFKVLETTKNIAVILLWIQIVTVLLLFFILLALVALLITTNPDLEAERKVVITPVVRWLSRRVVVRLEVLTEHWLVFVVFGALAAGIGIAMWLARMARLPRADAEGVGREAEDADGEINDEEEEETAEEIAERITEKEDI